MRKWFKYDLSSAQRGVIFQKPDQNFSEHQRAMGGYLADEGYASKEAFLQKYFFGYQYRRFEYYNNFLRRTLSKEGEVFSVASGRCVNELYLAEDGYRVRCSDLEQFAGYESTVKLFPAFKFMRFNVLTDSFLQQYDAIMALSLIYLFDQNDFRKFMHKMSEGLKKGGHLILDSAGAPDNFFSFFLHDIFLKYETALKGAVKSLVKKEHYGFVIKDFGYRRTDEEIIKEAKLWGLKLVQQHNYAYLTEFHRSYVLHKLITSSFVMQQMFGWLGQSMPYIRMFQFEKV